MRRRAVPDGPTFCWSLVSSSVTRTRRGISITAAALALWFVAAAPASAYTVSSSGTKAATPASVTTGSFAYSGGTTTCSATKPYLRTTASFTANGTSVSGYLVVSVYKNAKSSTSGGTLLGTVTSPSFSVPAGSKIAYSKIVAYQCRSVSTTTTAYYYYATAKFMNTSGSYATDAFPYSGILKLAKGCAT